MAITTGGPACGLLDGRLVTLSLDLPRGDRARIALWSKNLADKKYKAYVIGLGDITGYVSQAYTLGEPRSAGYQSGLRILKTGKSCNGAADRININALTVGRDAPGGREFHARARDGGQRIARSGRFRQGQAIPRTAARPVSRNARPCRCRSY